MYYGVEYYPQHWPEERWAVDAEMMQRAGLNLIRLGVFGWSHFEPRPGEFHFETYDRVIRLFHDHGIKTIMCTCSRVPPPWVLKKYPGMLTTRPNGQVNTPGQRYQMAMAHPDFIRESRRIDRALIEHFAGNPAIEAWQIDNEIGSNNDCYCDDCVERFQEFLRKKYQTVEALNDAWGAHFWSASYSDFTEVARPTTHPQLNLEYRRFLSRLNCEFTQWRADLIRELDPGKWVATNFQLVHRDHTDYVEMARCLDVNGINHYPAISEELALDVYRNGKKPLFVMEQMTRLLPVDSGEGWMRLWAYLALAHGCIGINFFRWRCCRWGQEQFADGLLPHGGQENRLYHELVRMGGEMKQIGAQIDATAPDARVAIALGYDTRWATGLLQPKAKQIDCVQEAVRIHEALIRRNTTTDALDPREALSAYRLVIAPHLMLVDEAITENLKSYVEAGGVLCLTAHSGVVDEGGKSFDTPRPGPLAEMAGIEVHDLALLNREFRLSSDAVPGLDGAAGTVMADEIVSRGAEVLVTYASGWRKGMPALTMHPYGKGRVYYLGTVLEPAAMDVLVDLLCEVSGVEAVMQTPEGVRAYERKGAEGSLIFLLNFTEEMQNVDLPGEWVDAFTGETPGAVQINPVDLRIFRRR